METLGKRIVARRKALGLTQDVLAEKLGVTAQAVSKWENDQSCPDITMLPKLAEVFGITTDALLGMEPPARLAEVVAEKETAPEAPGFDLRWDGGQKSSLGLALWVLLTGTVLLLDKMTLGSGISLWDTLWTGGLMLFGLFGLYPRFSFLRLGCALLGGYCLTDKLGILCETQYLNKDLFLPLFLMLLGVSLLVKSWKNPRKGYLQINGHTFSSRNSCNYAGNRFDCSTSFGENSYLIQLPQLEGGEANVSFGSMTVDLSGCQEIAPGCTLDLNSAFGELTLLVPSRFRVETDENIAFAAIEMQGHPSPTAESILRVSCSASFGQVTVRYI